MGTAKSMICPLNISQINKTFVFYLDVQFDANITGNRKHNQNQNYCHTMVFSKRIYFTRTFKIQQLHWFYNFNLTREGNQVGLNGPITTPST